MRKDIIREVTSTVITLAKVTKVDGQLVTENLEDETVVGSVSIERAQKEAVKKHGAGTMVLSVEPKTEHYSMPVLDFMKHGTLVIKDEQQEAQL